ncbi:hypothetical protein ACVWWJ_000728 [Luteibacter sp. HA06]|jgi:hypothetical protein
MKSPSLKDKVAYYAKVREANYVNSLRIEGFDVSSRVGNKNASAQLPSKKSSRNRG